MPVAALAEHGSSATFLNLIMKTPWLLPRLSSVSDFIFKPLSESWLDVKTDPGAVFLLLRYSDAHADTDFPGCLENARAPVSESVLSLLRMGFSLDTTLVSNDSLVNALCRAAIASEIASITGKVSSELAWIGALFFDFKSLAKNHIQEYTDNATLMRQYGLPVWLRFVNLLSAKDGLEIATAAGLHPYLGEILLIADQYSRDGQAGKSLSVRHWEKKLKYPGLLDKVDVGAIVNKWFGGNIRTFVNSKRKTPESVIADSLQFAMDSIHENRLIQSRDNVESEAFKAALQNQIQSGSQRLNDMKLQSVVELAAGAGHEFNNPLAVIQGQSQFILARMDDLEIEETREKLKDSLGSIVRQAKRINLILRNLMQFARPNVPAPANLECNGIVETVIEKLEDWASEKKVKLSPVDGELFNCSIFADPYQARTILENITRNAIEAAGVGGWVRIGLENSGSGQILFFVEDSGPGPAREDVANLFDPFFSGRQAGRGQGLGLSVAWRLIKLNKGNISFVLPSGFKPTRFVISFPMNELSALNFSEQSASDFHDAIIKAA
jgi:signal transduction histidine kinase